MPMAVPCLVNDIYPLIYGYLDLPSKAMFALSCTRFLRLGIPHGSKGVRLICESAKRGYLGIIKWTRKHNIPRSILACELAAMGGHFETLKWMRVNGFYWDSDTCSNAAEGGYLEILQWARREGCSWSETTCFRATQNGHLETLQWLRQNGCSWKLEDILSVANSEILEWLRENGYQ